jgi:putative GTP pyrophosphokinase
LTPEAFGGLFRDTMKTMNTALLRKTYEEYSQEEYQTLLLGIVDEVQRLLSVSVPRFQIKHRVKDFEGYLHKLTKVEAGGHRPEHIEDMLGIRIICPFLDDLDEVERVMTNHFAIRGVDRKRQSQSVREFGYDATHFVMDIRGQGVAHPLPHVAPVCEVQLRTILQDAWAEVEHELIYKSDWPIPTYRIRRKLAALNANLALSDIIFQELRDFQREILRKQSKRRALAHEVPGLLSESDIHTDLLGDDVGSRAHDNLEKLIIEALSAHSDELFEKAIHLYSSALEMPGVEPVRSILINHRGMAYLALGNIDDAHADFLASTESDPANHRAWYNLGIALLSLQRLSSAQKAFEICLQLNPFSDDAMVKQIELLLTMGEREKARELLHRLEQAGVDADTVELLKRKMERLDDMDDE